MTSYRLRKLIKRTFATIAISAASLWISDWLILRFRISQDRNAYGQVEIHSSIAVRLKNKRIEQNPTTRSMQECVRSLFPHDDESPCWYLERHANQAETLDGRGWHFWYD